MNKIKILFLGLALAGVIGFPLVIFSQEANLSAPEINAVRENIFSGKGITVTGKADPDASIQLTLKDSSNNEIFSLSTNSDENGDWTGVFDQPIKKGNYYIQAFAQKDGFASLTINSEKINLEGAYTVIIRIFSALVLVFLVIFVIGWTWGRVSEIKRLRRILMSQRDAAASYNVIKKDVDRSLQIMASETLDAGQENELRFLLGKISDNVEKMNKYVVAGIQTIGKYDIIEKINNKFKFK